jgi:hypothetical protein
MRGKITKWRVGKKPLYQRWTEALARTMRPDETPQDAARRFTVWLKACNYLWEINQDSNE